MNKAMPLVTFAIGATIGSAVTWYFVKTKYEQIAQEEIDSVKDVFSKKHGDDFNKHNTCISNDDHISEKKAAQAREKPDIIEYATTLKNEGYTNYSNMEPSMPEIETEKSMDGEKPYVISPNEFDELDDYETISLTYYADNVLADDMDELVEDADNVVGVDFASHFGEYEDDSVFVRNDRLKADYEILRDERNYSDVRKSKPYL